MLLAKQAVCELFGGLAILIGFGLALASLYIVISLLCIIAQSIARYFKRKRS